LAGHVWYHTSDGRISRITHNLSDTFDLTLSTNGRQTGNPAVVDDFMWLAMAGRHFKQERF
jgi:hypothetical protein